MIYTPDNWILVRLYSPEHGETFRVLAGWYGGYTGGDSWRMSSGVVKEEDCGNYIDFHNHSGSVYRCYKQVQGMSRYTSDVFASFKAQGADGMTIDLVERDFGGGRLQGH